MRDEQIQPVTGNLPRQSNAGRRRRGVRPNTFRRVEREQWRTTHALPQLARDPGGRDQIHLLSRVDRVTRHKHGERDAIGAVEDGHGCALQQGAG